jgi:hypothetical protein
LASLNPPQRDFDAAAAPDGFQSPCSNGSPHAFRALGTALLLGLCCVLIYNANLRQIGSGDSLPARYQPLGLWHYGTLGLDPIARWVARGHVSAAEWDHVPTGDLPIMPPAYWMVRGPKKHLVSCYPVVAPLLVAPLYLPAVAYLSKHQWKQPAVDRVAEVMEKLGASLLAACATIVMWVLLRRDSARWGFLLALAFAFGTNTWMTSSQALGQHGAGELLIALALLLALSPDREWKIAALGAICVLIAANRPPDVLLAAPIALHVMWARKRATPWLVTGAAIPLALFLLYNIGVTGSVIGGYGRIDKPDASLFQHSVLPGIAGLLLSPARGLLVFSPFLIFVPLGLWQRLRSPGTRSLAIALAVGAILQLFLYGLIDWRGGMDWGPRFMTDMLPVLFWLLAPAVFVLRWFLRGLLLFMMAVSVAIQAVGAFWYDGTSDLIIFGGDRPSMRAAWDFANLPVLVELRHPPAPGELQCGATATVDRIGPTMHPDAAASPPVLAQGSLIEGWALACGRTPAEVFLIIDGIIVGSTRQFGARPDVALAMHADSPSGWAVSAKTRGVRPGEHVLQVALRLKPNPKSQPRIVQELRVLVQSEAAHEKGATPVAELRGMADAAVAALRARQNAPGYWLTSFTLGTQFEAPHVEMNTFLTAAMIDLLDPIAREYNLDKALNEARRHLAAQIEGNGLVRYHGLPDAPTINKLGYVITPDADDTALAWRITGTDADARREPMLKELGAYRDSRGLYRTWLAPREQYQSLDPGKDSNPVDATIQMHVYMMLRQFDPPAAQNLCAALQRAMRGDDLWVYYAKAPLIPYLRAAELRRLGCDLPLPGDFLARATAGQELWSEAVRRFVGEADLSPTADDRQAILALLGKIGRNDFAEVHRSPPLLYHNDLTASASRYYWSEDFGYALWLRLYYFAREPRDSVLKDPP